MRICGEVGRACGNGQAGFRERAVTAACDVKSGTNAPFSLSHDNLRDHIALGMLNSVRIVQLARNAPVFVGAPQPGTERIRTPPEVLHLLLKAWCYFHPRYQRILRGIIVHSIVRPSRESMKQLTIHGLFSIRVGDIGRLCVGDHLCIRQVRYRIRKGVPMREMQVKWSSAKAFRLPFHST